MAKIYKIAVTGGAGSGKTSVCNRFRELGVKVISSDMLAREAVKKGSVAFKKIVDLFGEKILLNDGNLNRALLRRMITGDKTAKITLEQFIHPEISRIMRKRITEAIKDGDSIIIVEVPLLFELGKENEFDKVVLVSSDDKLRIKRLMARDKVSRSDAENLLDVQMLEKDKIARAQFIVKNNGSMARLINSVDLFYEKFIKKQ